MVIVSDASPVCLAGELYTFSVSPTRREALVCMVFCPSSRNAKVAMKKTVEKFGSGTFFVNDSGSENLREAQEYLASLGITQCWTRPKNPKEKPFVGRLLNDICAISPKYFFKNIFTQSQNFLTQIASVVHEISTKIA